MSATDTGAPTTGPILMELDPKAWETQLDRVEAWLNAVVTTQTAFRKLVEDTLPGVEKPNLHLYLSEILDTARRHEQAAGDLFRHIGRQPGTGRQAMGVLMGKAHEVVADLEGLAGGAAGPWRDLRQMVIANMDAMGAFAVAEQLGLALGIHGLRDAAFPVVMEKSTQHLVLQELMLEMASMAILYREKL
ncbi:hypothetical protein [Arenibaculum sp.]|uniref:hypothetical protein n=1 Tax=Arenibaculum sp. TaxID=2865862 RepID=UPI002E13505E|nr:hypothetical protein [Arenibaculum sp.]